MGSYFLFFSIVGIFMLTCLFLACFAMGLLALCELVEQKPNFLKKLVTKFIYLIAAAHLGFIFFDCLSLWRLLISLLVLALNFRLHLDLPKLNLVPSLSNGAAVLFNHFLWFSYFFRNHHPMWEVISFYFFIVWSVPLFIVISYSTTEVLPGFYEEQSYKAQKRKY